MTCEPERRFSQSFSDLLVTFAFVAAVVQASGLAGISSKYVVGILTDCRLEMVGRRGF